MAAITQEYIKAQVAESRSKQRFKTAAAIELMSAQLDILNNCVKEMSKQMKILAKEQSKMEVQIAKKEANPRGFQQPVFVSNELCDLLGLERGIKTSRQVVMSLVYKYIKDNRLEDPNDRRKIVPDANLTAIFDLQPGEVPHYFNIQSFVKHHFRNANTVAADEEVGVTEDVEEQAPEIAST